MTKLLEKLRKSPVKQKIIDQIVDERQLEHFLTDQDMKAGAVEVFLTRMLHHFEAELLVETATPN